MLVCPDVLELNAVTFTEEVVAGESIGGAGAELIVHRNGVLSRAEEALLFRGRTAWHDREVGVLRSPIFVFKVGDIDLLVAAFRRGFTVGGGSRSRCCRSGTFLPLCVRIAADGNGKKSA